MELTALTSTKDLLGASYGKTKLAGDTSSSNFSELLPADRKPTDRRDPVKSGAPDRIPTGPERDSAPKAKANEPETPDAARDAAPDAPTRTTGQQTDSREVAEKPTGTGETPAREQASQPPREDGRAEPTPQGDSQPDAGARSADEPAKPVADNPQGPTTASPTTDKTGNVETSGAPRPATAAALIATLAGVPAEPAAAPHRQAPAAAATTGTPDGAVVNPGVQMESAGRAAAAYAAVQPQPTAPSNPLPTTAAATPAQAATPTVPPQAAAPAQTAAAAVDVPPPAPTTAPTSPTPMPTSAPTSASAPAPVPTGEAAAPAPATPATPAAPATSATPAQASTAGEVPASPKSEQSTAQIIESLVRAGGDPARRVRGGLAPERATLSGPSTPGLSPTAGRNGTPQAAATPTTVQPPAIAQSTPTTPNQPSVTIAAAAVAPVQASEGQTAAVTDNGRFTVDAGRSTIALPDQTGSAVIKTAESQAAAATRSGRAPAQVPAAEQVAVRIQKAIATGTDRIEVHLKPSSLGRVNVALEFAHDGRVLAVVTADSPDTLDMLKQDARSLERALQDAGLKTDSGSLSFNLRGNGQDSAKANGFGGDGGQGNVGEEPAEDPASTEMPPRLISGSGLLDIHV